MKYSKPSSNLQTLPVGEWWSFFYIIKYPPSMAYMALTLGVSAILLYSFYRINLKNSAAPRWLIPFEILGGSALFFYVSHLFLYALMGILMGSKDISPVGSYMGWIGGLVLLGQLPVSIRSRLKKL